MKIASISNILNKRLLNFTSKTEISNQNSLEKDSFKKEDVQYNFTYNNVSSSALNSKSILKGQSVINGVSYGKEYTLNLDKKRNVTIISGKIGEDDVAITSKRQKNLSNIFEIEGQVGNKKVSLIEKDGFWANKKITGNFGNEPINIVIQNFRHNDMIKGNGVNMDLMYYTDFKNQPKYVGTYQLSPEFLPILAGLTRYM